MLHIIKIDYQLEHLNKTNSLNVVQIPLIICHRNKGKMVRCQYISIRLNVHNRFKQRNALLKYETLKTEKIEKYLEYLKMKYAFNFNAFFIFSSQQSWYMSYEVSFN